MKRIISVLAVMAIMAAMVAFYAVPAFALGPASDEAGCKGQIMSEAGEAPPGYVGELQSQDGQDGVLGDIFGSARSCGNPNANPEGGGAS